MQKAVERIALVLMSLLSGCASQPLDSAFDFSHVDGALRYFEAPDDSLLVELSETRAARHLKRHSDHAGYYDPDATTYDIVRDLLLRRGLPDKALLRDVQELVDYARKNPSKQSECIREAARFTPEAGRQPTSLFATWGYDIGVASDIGASLNFVHPHFKKSPEEIWFYCVHEAHHVGVIRLHAFPIIQDTKRVGDLVELIRYLTFLEGTAVFAAYDLRKKEGALDNDGDYKALSDKPRMEMISNRYAELLHKLSIRNPDDPVTDEEWKDVEEMSDGQRLWYRHGARMAMTIHAAKGLEGLRDTIAIGPDGFFTAYEDAATVGH